METRKVVVIGAGHVGSHCACALADAGVCEEIVLVDRLPEKAAAQALDVADSVSLLPHSVIVRSGDYADCSRANLVVIAIGEPRLPGQTRLDLLGRSVELLKGLVQELKPLHLTCPVVTITNPADIVADYVRKSLELERWRCFGTGTLLDTARLVRCISRSAGVDHRSVSAFSMGEHGDSSMVPFSAVTVGGVPFDRLGIEREIILKQTRRAGMEIIEGKGSTEFGIGRALAVLAGCILRDEKQILPVSVLLDGEYGQRDVHCGVPCRIGKNGIEEIIQLKLTMEEQRMLDASCQVIKTHIHMAAAL